MKPEIPEATAGPSAEMDAHPDDSRRRPRAGLSPARYWVRLPDGREYGPFSLELMQQWRRAGHLHWAIGIRVGAAAPWQILGDAPELLQDAPGESAHHQAVGELPPWKIHRATGRTLYSMDVEADYVRLRMWAHGALSALNFLVGWSGYYFPIPGGNTWALWGGYLLSSPEPTRLVGFINVDVSLAETWAQLFTVIGLGFWPAMLAGGHWLGHHLSTAAAGFLLLDFVVHVIFGGFAMFGLGPWVGFGVALPMIPAAVILEALVFFARRMKQHPR